MKVVAPIREIPSYPIDETPKEVDCDIICGYCGNKIDEYKSSPTWYTRIFVNRKFVKNAEH